MLFDSIFEIINRFEVDKWQRIKDDRDSMKRQLSRIIAGILTVIFCWWAEAQQYVEGTVSETETPAMWRVGLPGVTNMSGFMEMKTSPPGLLIGTNGPAFRKVTNMPRFITFTNRPGLVGVTNLPPPVVFTSPPAGLLRFTDQPSFSGVTNKKTLAGELPIKEEVTHTAEEKDIPEEAEEDEVAGEEVSPKEQMIGIKYEDMDLDEILKQYSEWTGRAIMKAPGVPSVKINLKCPKPLPKKEALLAIEGVLGMHGIGLVPMGDMFLKVVKIGEARQAGMKIDLGPLEEDIAETDHLISQVIELKHVEISEIQGLIKEMLHSYGKVIPLERVNCIMVTDSAVNVDRILELLKYIDQPIEAKEELRIFPIVYAKASEIQSKIEAIIADAQTRETRNTLIRQQLLAARMPLRARRTPRLGPKTSVTDVSKPLFDKGLIQGKVKIVADDRINSLIIIARPEQFRFFENLIQALDRKVEPDVTIKVITLEYADAKEVVSVLNSLVGSASTSGEGTRLMQPKIPVKGKTDSQPAKKETKKTEGEIQITGKLSGDVKIIADTRINALLVMASKADMAVIEDVLDQIDVMLAQVLIEVVIVEIGLKDNFSTGIDWLQRSMIAYNEKAGGGRRPFMAFSGTGKEGTGGDIKNASTINTVGDSTAAAGSGLTYYFTYFDLNIDAVLNMLASTSDARILSTPIILTTDNTEAKILVGEKRPIVTSTSITSGGVQQSAYEYKDIGIELKVTPHINKKGFVVMDIIQNIDNVAGNETIDGNQVPIITTREFSASIAVNDRRTIVLGGLVSADETKDQSGVPFLKDIPLLGLLFRADDKKTVRWELMVMITPYVLDTPEKVYTETARRHFAIDKARTIFVKGWSDSELASPAPEKKKKRRKKD